jgi:hypothetical protein
MPPKGKAAAKGAKAVEPEPTVSHEKPTLEPIPPCQTIYIKNLNEKIRKPGIDSTSLISF